MIMKQHARPRLAICTNFVSPYRAPVFDALGEMGFDVRIFTDVDREADRGWDVIDRGQHFETAQCRTWTRTKTVTLGDAPLRVESHVPWSLPAALQRFNPDCVISGECGVRSALASAWCKVNRRPLVIWTYHARNGRPKSNAVRRRVLGSANAWVGMGTQAREVLIDEGCDDARIFDAPNAAAWDTIAARLEGTDFESQVASCRDTADGRRLAIIVGRLIPMKGVDRMIDAWSVLPETVREAWRLVVVGDGPMRAALEARAGDSAKFVGSVDAAMMPAWFSAADLHIFPSLSDPWGLVVNEAMQCGTPTLCSTKAGCADDLVTDGEDGFLFDPTASTESVRDALVRSLTHASLSSLGSRAAGRVLGFTPHRMALGMAEAVASCRRIARVSSPMTEVHA